MMMPIAIRKCVFDRCLENIVKVFFSIQLFRKISDVLIIIVGTLGGNAMEYDRKNSLI
jgi:hypothetical protein